MGVPANSLVSVLLFPPCGIVWLTQSQDREGNGGDGVHLSVTTSLIADANSFCFSRFVPFSPLHSLSPSLYVRLRRSLYSTLSSLSAY